MAVYAGQWGNFNGANGTASVASSASATSVSLRCHSMEPLSLKKRA